VVAGGSIFALIGLGIIGTMSLAPSWRLGAALVWCLVSVRELFVITSGYKRFCGLRIYETGAIELLGADGRCCTAKTLPGSVVLRRIAWLRLAPEKGRPYAELVRENSAEDEAWRRFQVIWRHLGVGS
jgi:hypothetical protein